MSDVIENQTHAAEEEESPRAVWASVGMFVLLAVLGSSCIGLQIFFN